MSPHVDEKITQIEMSPQQMWETSLKLDLNEPGGLDRFLASNFYNTTRGETIAEKFARYQKGVSYGLEKLVEYLTSEINCRSNFDEFEGVLTDEDIEKLSVQLKRLDAGNLTLEEMNLEKAVAGFILMPLVANALLDMNVNPTQNQESPLVRGKSYGRFRAKFSGYGLAAVMALSSVACGGGRRNTDSPVPIPTHVLQDAIVSFDPCYPSGAISEGAAVLPFSGNEVARLAAIIDSGNSVPITGSSPTFGYLIALLKTGNNELGSCFNNGWLDENRQYYEDKTIGDIIADIERAGIIDSTESVLSDEELIQISMARLASFLRNNNLPLSAIPQKVVLHSYPDDSEHPGFYDHFDRSLNIAANVNEEDFYRILSHELMHYYLFNYQIAMDTFTKDQFGRFVDAAIENAFNREDLDQRYMNYSYAVFVNEDIVVTIFGHEMLYSELIDRISSDSGSTELWQEEIDHMLANTSDSVVPKAYIQALLFKLARDVLNNPEKYPDIPPEVRASLINDLLHATYDISVIESNLLKYGNLYQDQVVEQLYHHLGGNFTLNELGTAFDEGYIEKEVLSVVDEGNGSVTVTFEGDISIELEAIETWPLARGEDVSDCSNGDTEWPLICGSKPYFYISVRNMSVEMYIIAPNGENGFSPRYVLSNPS